MEGTTGEIRLFGGTFAPAGWMFCQGQPLQISGNEALFTLIGTIYGGDGVSTFQLPNLQSRVVIGTGQGLGLSNYLVGQVGGVESVSLTSANLPQHNHAVTTVTAGAGAVTATLTLNAAASGSSAVTDPSGALIGSDANVPMYSTDKTKTPTITMSPTSINFPSTPLITTANADVMGGSAPHENRQPFLATNYIICVQGIFPSRD